MFQFLAFLVGIARAGEEWPTWLSVILQQTQCIQRHGRYYFKTNVLAMIHIAGGAEMAAKRGQGCDQGQRCN
jgi:hypothetical protein